MMSIDIKSSTYIDCEVKNTDKYPAFVVVDHLRIWKYPIFLHCILDIRNKTFIVKKLWEHFVINYMLSERAMITCLIAG